MSSEVRSGQLWARNFEGDTEIGYIVMTLCQHPGGSWPGGSWLCSYVWADDRCAFDHQALAKAHAQTTFYVASPLWTLLSDVSHV